MKKQPHLVKKKHQIVWFGLKLGSILCLKWKISIGRTTAQCEPRFLFSY